MWNSSQTCCFSGYRPEKILGWSASQVNSPKFLSSLLDSAVEKAYQDGYQLFITGMCRGFDLWAAQSVLRMRQHYPIQLLCAIPFDDQALAWPSAWRKFYKEILLQADFVHSLASKYTPDCYYVRNRFMIQNSSRLICWFDGVSGGTAFTVQCAKRCGLEIENLMYSSKDIS